MPRKYTRIRLFHHMLPEHIRLYRATMANITSQMPRFPLGLSKPILESAPLDRTRFRIVLPIYPSDTLLNLCNEMFHTWQGISRTASEFKASLVLLSGLPEDVAHSNFQHLLDRFPEGINLGSMEALSIISPPKNLGMQDRALVKQGLLKNIDLHDVVLKTFPFRGVAQIGKKVGILDDSIGDVGETFADAPPSMMEHELASNIKADNVSPAIYPIEGAIHLGENVVPDTTPWIERGLKTDRPTTSYRGREVPHEIGRRIPLNEDTEMSRQKFLHRYRKQYMPRQTIRRIPLTDNGFVNEVSHRELYGERVIRSEAERKFGSIVPSQLASEKYSNFSRAELAGNDIKDLVSCEDDADIDPSDDALGVERKSVTYRVPVSVRRPEYMI